MKNLMVLGCAAMVMCGAMAESVVTNGYTWTYSISDGKATIWVVRPSPTGVVDIPASLGGCPVDAIGESVFLGCAGISSVAIPVCITSIGEAAFSGCENLSYVILPSGIGTLSVGAHAFEDNTSVSVEARHGYSISWTNVTGEVVADPFHSSSAVTVSPLWTRIEPWDFLEGLVAHYAFDGNADDISGNGNDGVIHNVVSTIDRHGNADNAFHFNGTSAYVEVLDSESVREVGQSVTVSAWVKPESLDGSEPDWVSVICKGQDDKHRQYGVQVNNKSGRWLFNKYNDSKANELTLKPMQLGRWNHVSVTYSTTLISAYLNGELVGTMAPLGNIVENSESLYIGLDPPGDAEYLNGDMDEVRVYNRALSAMEVRALANGDNPVAKNIGDGVWVYQYDVDDGVGFVWSGFGEITSVLHVPDSIGGKQVIQIGAYAFYDCMSLERIMLPSTISSLTVGGNAFNRSTMVEVVDREGYEFLGWRNSEGRIKSDPFHSGETVTVSPVWGKIETADFDGRRWTYSVTDGEATIGVGMVAVCPTPDGDVVIPAELGGYPVTGIASNAFKNCTGVTSLKIPSNVTTVGICAFDGCSGLTNLVIEGEEFSCAMPGLMQAKFDMCFDTTSILNDANGASNVSGIIAAYQHVGSSPWEFTDPLTGKVYSWNETNTSFAYFGQMYLEEGKTYVFGSNFDDDAYVKIEDSVVLNAIKAGEKTVATGAFVCERSGWHDVDVRVGDVSGGKGSWGGRNGVWSADFGLGYRDDGSTNTTQSGWSRLIDPGDGSLFRCDGLRTVFVGCSNLVSVTMPWPMMTTMSAIFPDGYDKLESVILTGGVEEIPNCAFRGCVSLRSIDIPSGVSKIGRVAFAGCRSLESLAIPSGRVMVGDEAFSGCDGIRSVVLPLDVSRSGLVQVKFNTNNDFISSIYDAPDQSKVSGVLMGYAYDTKTAQTNFTDAVYGGSYKWNVQATTFGYGGYMYMTAGMMYVFGKYFDDSVYVAVDGAEVLKNTTHTDFATGSFVPDYTGWHSIDVRVADGTGSKGPKGGTSGTHPWSINMGVGWRDDGVTNAIPETSWHKLMDPGDGSLFRVEANMTLGELLPDSYSLITNVVLDASVCTAIPANCLNGCSSVTELVIPDGVEKVGSKAFWECCSATNTLIIPESVKQLGDEAFGGCTNLANVIISSGIGTVCVGAEMFDESVAVEIPNREGYAFCGWTNVTGVVIDDPFHSTTAVTVSPWWKKTVTIAYDAQDGMGTMVAQTVLEGDDLTLTDNAFVRDGCEFIGWSDRMGGDAKFADGETIADIAASADGTVLYAVWKLCAPAIVPAGTIAFPNASQTVTILSDAREATILYTTDGSSPLKNGREYKGAFTVYTSCTIRAAVVANGIISSDESTSVLTRGELLSGAANLYGYTMETDAVVPWVVDGEVSHDCVSSVRSGAIGNNGATWLQTSIKKAGTVSFWWKAACEEADEEEGEDGYYDYGAFLVDDVIVARIAGHDGEWHYVSHEITSGGKHTLRWEYRKDGSTTYAPDCVWVDQVQWIPADGSGYTLTTPEPVPYSWLDAYRLGIGTDYETAGNAASGKMGSGSALQVWQDYVAGTDPTNLASRFTAKIEMVDGAPVVTWEPDLNTNGVIRAYKVYGKETLEGGGEWQYPTNSLHRFFKVTVEMP